MDNQPKKVMDVSTAGAKPDGGMVIPVTIKPGSPPAATVTEPAPMPTPSPAAPPAASSTVTVSTAAPTPTAEEALSNVPKFGELQPKVDAHPLFSGAKDPRPKRSGLLRKTLWPIVSLLIVLILLYLAIDSGLIKTNINLPYHFFKQPVASTAPQIQAPAATTQNTQAATADPYAGWKTFTSQYQKMNLRYPSDWQLTDSTSTHTPKNDLFSLKSSDGFTISFQALVPVGAASSELTAVSNDPISFTGQSDYLIYYSSDATKNKMTTGPVSSATMSTSLSKITMPLAHTTDGSIWDISLMSPAPIQLSDLSTNTDLQTAKLILKSAAY